MSKLKAKINFDQNLSMITVTDDDVEKLCETKKRYD